MTYVSTSLEDLVKELYHKIDVKDPDYVIEDIASKLGVNLSYFKLPFTIPGTININPTHSKKEQKEVFAHELYHNLYHVGIQLDMPEQFRLMQEYKAFNFAMHFCIPTFMLKHLDFPKYRCHAVSMIADTFGTTDTFADKRLDHYEKQITGAMFYEEITKCKEPETDYIQQEIDIYDDLPFYETPEFKMLEKQYREHGATDQDIDRLIKQIEIKRDDS